MLNLNSLAAFGGDQRCSSKAGGYVDFAAKGVDRIERDQLADAFRHYLAAGIVGFREYDQKLFAAIAGNPVDAAPD